MRLLIHDLQKEEYNRLFPELAKDIRVVSAEEGEIAKCVGCFQCWIKTPGACVIRDRYGEMGRIMGKSDECIIISRLHYGCYSPFVKNVLDRNIGYILPFFEIRNKEMHHVPRYQEKILLTVFGYGDLITEKEKSVFRNLVKANGVNFNAREERVFFASDVEEIKGFREVWG